MKQSRYFFSTCLQPYMCINEFLSLRYSLDSYMLLHFWPFQIHKKRFLFHYKPGLSDTEYNCTETGSNSRQCQTSIDPDASAVKLIRTSDNKTLYLMIFSFSLCLKPYKLLKNNCWILNEVLHLQPSSQCLISHINIYLLSLSTEVSPSCQAFSLLRRIISVLQEPFSHCVTLLACNRQTFSY